LDEWGRKMRTPPLEVHHHLLRLAKLDLIHYMPASGEPSIAFFSPYQTLNPEVLNWKKYKFLQAQQSYRLEKMLQYVQSKEICRSLMIQHYFGEQEHRPCGRCDVCIGRHKTKVSDIEFKSLMKTILDRIRQAPTNYRRIMLEVPEGSPSQREKVLRYLLDQKIILADGRGNLSIRE
jgi:ATP-dependent DNA helicase RecQ